MRWSRPLVLAAIVVALIAGGVTAGLVLTSGDDSESLGPAPTSTPVTTPPPTTAPPTGTPTATTSTASTATVPVYYLHDDGQAVKLYREFHRVPAPDGVIAAAVTAMLSTPPDDPDYSSLWPDGTTMLGVDVSGDTATVNLSKEARGPFNGGSDAAAKTLQQLVWTVTAADTSVTRVVLHIDGAAAGELWGSVDASGPQQRAKPSYDVLGSVWVLAPTQGAVTSSPVEISGVATVFEGTVSIDILQGGKVVKHTFATASEGAPARGDWKTSVTLSPGTYLVRAYEESADNGQPLHVDDKEFRVQ